MAVNNPQIDFATFAEQHYGGKPHPASQTGIAVRDWPTAVKVATAAKFGGQAEPHEVDLFWPEFQAMQMPAAQFLDLLDTLSKWSFRYHNQPPKMSEIQLLKDAKPGEQHKHYQDLPDQHYPDISAGDMMKALAKADPYAKQHLGKGALKNEARFVHHAGLGPGQIDTYYQQLKTDREAKRAPKAQAEAF